MENEELKNGDNSSQSGSSNRLEKGDSCSGSVMTHSPLSSLPGISQLGWGHWFTLRDLEVATKSFSGDNIIGEGGYGVVYKGCLSNGTLVAVKRLFNDL